MSTKSFCNGCGSTLRQPGPYENDTKASAISGALTKGIVGGDPLPSEDFDWCVECAMIAFQAVKDAQYERWWQQESKKVKTTILRDLERARDAFQTASNSMRPR